MRSSQNETHLPSLGSGDTPQQSYAPTRTDPGRTSLPVLASPVMERRQQWQSSRAVTEGSLAVQPPRPNNYKENVEPYAPPLTSSESGYAAKQQTPFQSPPIRRRHASNRSVSPGYSLGGVQQAVPRQESQSRGLGSTSPSGPVLQPIQQSIVRQESHMIPRQQSTISFRQGLVQPPTQQPVQQQQPPPSMSRQPSRASQLDYPAAAVPPTQQPVYQQTPQPISRQDTHVLSRQPSRASQLDYPAAAAPPTQQPVYQQAPQPISRQDTHVLSRQPSRASQLDYPAAAAVPPTQQPVYQQAPPPISRQDTHVLSRQPSRASQLNYPAAAVPPTQQTVYQQAPPPMSRQDTHVLSRQPSRASQLDYPAAAVPSTQQPPPPMSRQPSRASQLDYPAAAVPSTQQPPPTLSRQPSRASQLNYPAAAVPPTQQPVYQQAPPPMSRQPSRASQLDYPAAAVPPTQQSVYQQAPPPMSRQPSRASQLDYPATAAPRTQQPVYQQDVSSQRYQNQYQFISQEQQEPQFGNRRSRSSERLSDRTSVEQKMTLVQHPVNTLATESKSGHHSMSTEEMLSSYRSEGSTTDQDLSRYSGRKSHRDVEDYYLHSKRPPSGQSGRSSRSSGHRHRHHHRRHHGRHRLDQEDVTRQLNSAGSLPERQKPSNQPNMERRPSTVPEVPVALQSSQTSETRTTKSILKKTPSELNAKRKVIIKEHTMTPPYQSPVPERPASTTVVEPRNQEEQKTEAQEKSLVKTAVSSLEETLLQYAKLRARKRKRQHNHHHHHRRHHHHRSKESPALTVTDSIEHTRTPSAASESDQRPSSGRAIIEAIAVEQVSPKKVHISDTEVCEVVEDVRLVEKDLYTIQGVPVEERQVISVHVDQTLDSKCCDIVDSQIPQTIVYHQPFIEEDTRKREKVELRRESTVLAMDVPRNYKTLIRDDSKIMSDDILKEVKEDSTKDSTEEVIEESGSDTSEKSDSSKTSKSEDSDTKVSSDVDESVRSIEDSVDEDEMEEDEKKDRLSVVYDPESDCYIIGDVADDEDIYVLSYRPEKLVCFEKVVTKSSLEDPKLGWSLEHNIFDSSLSTSTFTSTDQVPKDTTRIRLLANEEKLARLFDEMPPLQFLLHPVKMADGERGGVMARCDVPLSKLWSSHDGNLPLEVERNFPWTKVKGKPVDDEVTRATMRVHLRLAKEGEDISSQVTEDLATSARLESEESLDNQIVVHPGIDGGILVKRWDGQASQRKKPTEEELNRLPLVEAAAKHRHLLRLEKGRRRGGLSPGRFQKNTDPENPVLIVDEWHTPTEQESIQEYILQNLDARLKEMDHIKAKKRFRTRPSDAYDLYTQAKMKRVLVYKNGGDPYTAIFVWGRSLYDILMNASDILKLTRPASIIYDVYGHRVYEFESLTRDQLVSISVGAPYMPPTDSKDMIEIKANWWRARNRYGPQATEIGVFHGHNPAVAVDPFESSVTQHKLYEHVNRPWKGVWVYENGRGKEDGSLIFGMSIQQLLHNAMKKLNMKQAPICFYTETGEKVDNLDQVYNEQALAASTCGKGFLPEHLI